MKAWVTGGAGFLGSHVADALVARGDEVTLVDDWRIQAACALGYRPQIGLRDDFQDTIEWYLRSGRD